MASLSRENLRPIYLNLKVLACCTMANKVHSTWVSWTVAGVLAFVFALLLSARVISHTVVTARRRRLEVRAGKGLYRGLEGGQVVMSCGVISGHSR